MRSYTPSNGVDTAGSTMDAEKLEQARPGTGAPRPRTTRPGTAGPQKVVPIRAKAGRVAPRDFSEIDSLMFGEDREDHEHEEERPQVNEKSDPVLRPNDINLDLPDHSRFSSTNENAEAQRREEEHNQ